MTQHSDLSPLISPLISAPDLHEILHDEDVGIVDCRFSLDDTQRGERDWGDSRIPGARYAHLDRDLSAPISEGQQGRHPLPDAKTIAAMRNAWGFSADTLIVCYDDAGGAFASRLWWMLRWIGHDAVCVLDGGWPAWMQGGYPTASGPPSFAAGPAMESQAVSDHDEWIAQPSDLLESGIQPVDARAPERFDGQVEPIDPVAGHIPGALNLPWQENLDADGRFLPPDALRERWLSVGGTEHAIAYCGSGVTACHNILAAAVAGLPLPRLYPPSWSGWISDPTRPIDRGLE